MAVAQARPCATVLGMRVALVTCRDLPDWEVDDAPLFAALERRGVGWERPVWNDAAVDWARFDACLVRTTWDYCEHLDAFLDWIDSASALTRLDNPPRVLRWNLDKSYLRDLEEQAVRVAPTVWLARGARVSLADLLASRGWSRAFVKPVVGAAARGTLRVAADDPVGLAAAQEHIDRALATAALMVQPYLVAVETEGELSTIHVDGAFAHGARKVPVPGDYRVQDDFGAHDEPWYPSDEERALASRIVALAGARFGLSAPLLYARVDFLRDREGALCLNELELVEPSLFLRHAPETAERLIDAWLARLGHASAAGALA